MTLAVDLNGAGGGIDFATGAYSEGGSGAAIGEAITVDVNLAPIMSATITITDAIAGDELNVTGTLPAGITILSSTGATLILFGVATQADWEAALLLVRYSSVSDNPDAFGTDPARTITVVVSDGVASSPAATATIAITAVNDDPVLTHLNGDSVTFTEGDPYVLLDQDLPVAITDPDNQNFAGGSFSVGVIVNPSTEDEFFVLNLGPVGTIGDDVYVEGTLVGTITSQGPGQLLTISFNANATPDLVAELADFIGYRNLAGDAPTPGARSVAYLLNDGDGGASAGSVTVDVIAVNDAPFIDLDSSDSPETGTALVYAEGQAPVIIAPSALVSDPDEPADFGGYTLTIAFTSNGTADDQLEIVSEGFGPTQIITFGSDIYYGGVKVATFAGGDDGNPLVISFNSAACGCSLEAVAASIAYSNSAADPSTLERSVTFTVDDGAASDNLGSAVAIISVIANDPPVLTDLADSVTFAENLVNATPQLLDASVTLTDPDGNFDGATLTVTGLLLEDEVGIRDVGTGPGEISVSGFDVSYGGILIGTVCGCSDSLTVEFNGDATAEAIEAVIENLTYFNYSDSPTPSRTLLINVTDSFGADLGAAPVATDTPHFEPLSSVQDPFRPFPVYGIAAPVFADVDGDGDLDLVVGDGYGIRAFFENDNGVFTPVADSENPFEELETENFAKPAFFDVDADGDLDLIVGGETGALQLFENDNGVFTELTGVDNPFDGILVDGASAPAFADLDGDGDLDLVVGEYYGIVHAFDNDNGVFTELTGSDNPFDGIQAYIGTPTFVDLDGDGDLDLVLGDYFGSLSAYENDGGTFTALTGADNPFGSALVGYLSAPAFADLDGDGDFDMVVGDYTGRLATFENTPAHGRAIVVNVTPENDSPLLDLDFRDSPAVNTSASFTEGDPPVTIAPYAVFADFDDPADYGGYIVTVEVTDNGDVGDTLTIADIGSGPDEIEISGSDVLYEGVVVGGFTGGTNGDPLVISFNSDSCACSVELVLANILFSNASQDPSELTRTISFTLDDGDGGTASAIATLGVTAVEDPPVAQPDSVSTPENAIGTGNLFADNGSGPDSDAEGDTLAISEVNGSAANVNSTITLASGAKLRVNSDGTYSYDPSGKFSYLISSAAAAATGAVNDGQTESFTYTLASGNTVTVVVNVTGVDGPGDQYWGNSTDNVITGTPGPDFFKVDQGGDDDLKGMAGNDVFLFGSALTGDDKVDGGLGNDQIAIQGDYSGGLTIGTGVVSIESLAILPGADTRFGDPGTNFYDYDLTMVDENVAAGATMVVDANRLRVGEDFTFDGSAESDGAFFIYGGGGTDTLTGGAGNDVFYFGENGQFGASDHVDGGPGGTDQLGLRGDYTIVFGATQLIGIESIGLVSALDTRFGALGTRYDYNLTMNDGNVAGIQMTVDAAPLRSGETLTFNGSAEDDGSFRIYGGHGNDVITGSQNADRICGGEGGDTLRGEGGNDVFVYRSVLDSLASGDRDGIQDFTDGDKIDLSAIDAKVGGGDDAFSFIGANAFSHTAGELQATVSGGIWTISGDVDGDGVADIQFFVVRGDANPIVATDFVL